MSEYQYYEFQAIDRPLTEKEMGELRAYSTRARITPTSFVNDYAWGNFKGDEDAWMEKYFDAFLYLANWGTRVLKLRLPAQLLDRKTARLYCVGDRAAAREKNGKVIVTFQSDDERGGEWVEGEGVLSSLISVRTELARGDLRCLYLGWLLCAQSGDLRDDESEPPVPSGLAQPSASLASLGEFLRIDTDWLHVAAKASAPMEETAPKTSEIRAWLAKFPATEKDELLTRLVAGNEPALANELLQRFARGPDQAGRAAGAEPIRRRTVGELLREVEQAAAERRRLEADRAEKEKARREREAAIARAKHLDEIEGKQAALWDRVERLIATVQPKSYDRAVELLVDLRDLAARESGGDFRRRLEALRAEHARKPSLIERLRKAGL